MTWCSVFLPLYLPSHIFFSELPDQIFLPTIKRTILQFLSMFWMQMTHLIYTLPMFTLKSAALVSIS